MSNLTTTIRNHKITRFFFPKIMPNDIVSNIYAQSFGWTFWTVLILAFIVYFVLGVDSPLFVEISNVILRGLSIITSIIGREYNWVENPETGGLFLLITFVYVLTFFFKNMNEIPPSIWDNNFKTVFKFLSTWFVIGIVSLLIIKVKILFEGSPDFGLVNFIFLVFFSYLYALLSINLVRILLGISSTYGLRKTNNSPYYKNSNISETNDISKNRKK